MKKVIITSLIILVLFVLASGTALADPGDEHRSNHEGTEGQGAIELHQNRINQ